MQKKVEIVLATYKPNRIFFEKLLKSLNEQDYSNLFLRIRDDSDDEIESEKVKKIVEREIKNIPFSLKTNERNLGSNKTFELLTEEAIGDYIAYCDQDDIWERNKISELIARMESENSLLGYSDLSVINEEDKLLADSFKDINKRLKHVYGESGVFEYLLRRPCVTGCTMMIRTNIAKEALPFCSEFYVHDHWLSLVSASKGKISYIAEPLIRYRIHDNNQIGSKMLDGIKSKEDYFEKKLLKDRRKFEFLLNVDLFPIEKKEKIQLTLDYLNHRISFFRKRKIHNFFKMISYFQTDLQLILFEIAICLLPNKISEKLLEKFSS